MSRRPPLWTPKPFLPQLNPNHDFSGPAVYPRRLLPMCCQNLQPRSPRLSPQEPTCGLLGAQPHLRPREKWLRLDTVAPNGLRWLTANRRMLTPSVSLTNTLCHLSGSGCHQHFPAGLPSYLNMSKLAIALSLSGCVSGSVTWGRGGGVGAGLGNRWNHRPPAEI